MAAKEEPSNPFKSPRKSPSTPNSKPSPGHQNTKSRKTSGPPVPPGGKRKQSPPVAPGEKRKQSPPIAPSGSKSSDNDKIAKSPARAGKSVGLRKQNDNVKVATESKTNLKAREVIEATRTNVVPGAKKPETQSTAKKEPYNPFKKNQPKRTTAPPRRGGGRFGKRNKPQGQAKRVQKLHRGKYMEFKYDVRRILEKENVDEEHRSNVLGQTWAKGERQGVSEAKAFLDEKVAEGIISEKCSTKIMKLIDSLTTRR